MGPWSETVQFRRATAIQRLLEQDLPDYTRAIWTRHLQNLSRDENEYNARVRAIYEHMKRNPIEW